jgi:hypothetical protein
MQFPALGYAAIASVTFPVAAGAVRLRLLDRALKTLLSLQFIYLIVTALQLYLALHNIRNLWLSHFFILIEYSFLIAVFSFWEKNKWAVKALFFSVVLFALFWILANFLFEPFAEPAIYTNSLARTIYCFVGLYTLRNITKDSTTLILRDPRFWIISSLLISSTGDLMFYSLRSVIVRLSPRDIFIAWSIHWILNIITNLLYSIGYFWKPLTNSGGPSALAQ